MSRLVIDVTGEQHQQIKALAALHGSTIKDFIMERLFPVDEEAAAWDELKELLLNRIKSAETGSISGKTIRKIAETKAKELGTV